MQSNPTPLALHPDPAKAVRTAVEILTAWIDIEHVRLGGGTALEARWHHRRSTDLDFFTTGSVGDELFYYHREKIIDDLRQLAHDGIIDSADVYLTRNEVLHFRIGTTPVSIGRVAMYHSDPCDEVEEETGVILSGTRDILTKKLHNRLEGNYIYVARDAYDFAVARLEAPDDLAYAWEIVHPEAKTTLIANYKELSREPNSDKVVDARYATIAANVWEHAHLLFASDLTYLPPLSRDAGEA